MVVCCAFFREELLHMCTGFVNSFCREFWLGWYFKNGRICSGNWGWHRCRGDLRRCSDDVRGRRSIRNITRRRYVRVNHKFPIIILEMLTRCLGFIEQDILFHTNSTIMGVVHPCPVQMPANVLHAHSRRLCCLLSPAPTQSLPIRTCLTGLVCDHRWPSTAFVDV
jgi:hypothetical protein